MRALSPAVRVSLLNGFRLLRNHEAISLPPSAQRLLAFVALFDRPLPRLQVAGTLWPDVPERRSCGSLRSALWRLRRPTFSLVLTSKQHLELNDSVTVDFREATRAAQRLITGQTGGASTLPPVLSDPADLLVGWYDDWVILERERFRQLRLRALESLCQSLTAVGRYVEAVQAGLAAVMSEPLRETSRRVLIQACVAEGNYSEALRHYQSYKQVLRAELGLEPSPHIQAVIAGIASSKATPN